MYERMLDKQKKPTIKEFIAYCGKSKEFYKNIDEFLTEELNTQKEMRFPYGKHYGWGIKYFIKNKHICDVFAEKDAITVMLRLTNSQYESIYDNLLSYTQDSIDQKYPCGNGGWIHYRVFAEEHLVDIKKILRLKVK